MNKRNAVLQWRLKRLYFSHLFSVLLMQKKECEINNQKLKFLNLLFFQDYSNWSKRKEKENKSFPMSGHQCQIKSDLML